MSPAVTPTSAPRPRAALRRRPAQGFAIASRVRSWTILVVNAGSSSVKFQLFALDGAAQLTRKIKGQVDGIGTRPRFRATGPNRTTLIDREYDAPTPGVAFPHQVGSGSRPPSSPPRTAGKPCCGRTHPSRAGLYSRNDCNYPAPAPSLAARPEQLSLRPRCRTWHHIPGTRSSASPPSTSAAPRPAHLLHQVPMVAVPGAACLPAVSNDIDHGHELLGPAEGRRFIEA